MIRFSLIFVVFAALAEAAPAVEVDVRAPDGPQHWDCGVRGALVIRNEGDADVKVAFAFELSPRWLIRGFGWPEFRRDPFETTAKAGSVSEHRFRLASPGPRRDERVELRLRVLFDGPEVDRPPPTYFDVTTLGEPLCH